MFWWNNTSGSFCNPIKCTLNIITLTKYKLINKILFIFDILVMVFLIKLRQFNTINQNLF